MLYWYWSLNFVGSNNFDIILRHNFVSKLGGMYFRAISHFNLSQLLAESQDLRRHARQRRVIYRVTKSFLITKKNWSAKKMETLMTLFGQKKKFWTLGFWDIGTSIFWYFRTKVSKSTQFFFHFDILLSASKWEIMEWFSPIIKWFGISK